MTPTRVDWLRVAVYTALLVGLCGIATLTGLAIERLLAWAGPWVLSHADWIVAIVLTACVVLLVVLAVAEKARKDNPTW